MEKLQPVIRQIFWVLFGLGLILILWAWYSANSALSAEIESEKAKVEATKKGAQKTVMGLPNGEWTADAEKLNEDHKGAFDESARKLWEQQLEARVYPKRIRKDLQQLQFRSKINEAAVRGIFAKLYNDYFEEQLAIIKPFKPETGLGLVDVQQAQITRENPVKWKNKIPTSQEIWNAQEDIWLVRSILNAIAQTNGAADRIDKAPIRALLQLQLRGGDPETEAGGSAGGGMDGAFGGGPGSGGLATGGAAGGGGFGMGEAMGGGGGLGGGGATGVWSTFKGSLTADLLTEEFGPDPNAGAGGMGGMGMGGPGMGGPGMGGPGYGGGDYGGGDYGGGDYGGGSGADTGGEDADSTSKRYVHYGNERSYKTRAFILKVKMIQKDIPALLAALPNGKFPVEIVRVDIDFTGAGGASGGGMSALGGGGPGGGGGAYGAGSYGGGDAYGGGMAGGLGLSGAGAGLGGPGLGGPGYGGGMSGGLGLGGTGTGNRTSRKERKQAENGAGVFNDAMADKRLATVRVAGLMTIYQTSEENAAEAESEDAAKTEVNESTEGLPALAPGDGVPDGETAEEATDGAVGVEASGVNGGLANDSNATDGSSPASPVDEKPDDTTDGAATDSGQPQAFRRYRPRIRFQVDACQLLTA